MSKIFFYPLRLVSRQSKAAALIIGIFFLMGCDKPGVTNSSGGSTLPDCKIGDEVKWTDCIGLIKYTDGDTYAGEFKGGKRSGLGVYQMKGGDRYEGDFKDNLRHGQGTYIYSSGDQYSGGWVEGERQGEGVYSYADGRRFVGKYENNKRIDGKEYNPSGKVIKEWKSGVSELKNNNFLIGLCTVNTEKWAEFNCNSSLAMRSDEMTIAFQTFEDSSIVVDLVFGSKCDQLLGASKCINKTIRGGATYELLSDGSIIQSTHAGGCVIPNKYTMEKDILYQDYAGEARGDCKDEQIAAARRMKEIGKRRIYYVRKT